MKVVWAAAALMTAAGIFLAKKRQQHSSSISGSILILNNREVQQLLPMKECIRVVGESLQSMSAGQSLLPLRSILKPALTMGVPGLFGLMPAIITGSNSDGQPIRSIGLKSITVFPGNPQHGRDSHQGCVTLYNDQTGELECVLNGSSITAIRTAAASAVATNVLARAGACKLVLVGCGHQAAPHLAAIACVRQLTQVIVVSKNVLNAARFASEQQPQYGFPIKSMASVEEAAREADIIVTITSSKEPVLKRAWIRPGTHLNVVGACTPNAREVDTATVVASSLFCDSLESLTHEAGDWLLAAKEAGLGLDHIQGEIGPLLANGIRPRASATEITLFKSLGVAVEDVAVSSFVYRSALERNIGTRVPFDVGSTH